MKLLDFGAPRTFLNVDLAKEHINVRITTRNHQLLQGDPVLLCLFHQDKPYFFG